MTGAHRVGQASPGDLPALEVPLAALRRLLERRDGDGALVQASPALIEAAIGATRKDLNRVRDILGRVAGDPADPNRVAAAALAGVVVELDAALDLLRGSLPPGA